MVLLDVDRDLLERCLQNSSEAWSAFVDRFAGLVAHVVDHTALTRSIALDQSTRDDLIAEVFLVLLQNNFAILRRFRGGSSLATYLAVVSRRIVVRSIKKRRSLQRQSASVAANDPAVFAAAISNPSEWENQEQLEFAMKSLTNEEAAAVRMFHLEGKSYREISISIGMAENSIGPFLTRAREKMRRKVEHT